MINFIYIYSFIPMSGCVGMGPSALLFPRAHDNARAKTALNTHLSYIPPMSMLQIYRPRWTQSDDNTLHDPLGLVMVR
jgi:hypothetical protein